MTPALLLCLFCFAQDPQPGISRELAQARAALVSDLACNLQLRLDANAKDVQGRISLTFTLASTRDPAAPLVLDFAGQELAEFQVNEKPTAVRAVADHVVIPAELLVSGYNRVTAQFRSAVAPTGTPLTSYRDPSDGREFYYTLVVPADAHRLYPCFDQPDLRTRFRLDLDLPAEWVAVANGAEMPVAAQPPEGRRYWSFRETVPLPTYLMAFACGAFAIVPGPALQAPGIDAQAPFRIFVRPSQQKLLDREAVAKLHIEGLRWLCTYFNVDYPFRKLDIALLPGFPYGGMEHAGAIFYREQSLAFDHPPTDGELARRSTLIYHELSHQWFGNYVTMRWFDDLWLKEGFATFLAHLAMAELEPERQSWLRFLQRVKPRAYEVDGTPGTVPVFQELQNLADAKSAYGPIVYNKAPAVLRELHDRLGAGAFRAGLTRFLQAHALGNATWRDLAGALEASGRADLGDGPSVGCWRLRCRRFVSGGNWTATVSCRPPLCGKQQSTALVVGHCSLSCVYSTSPVDVASSKCKVIWEKRRFPNSSARPLQRACSPIPRMSPMASSFRMRLAGNGSCSMSGANATRSCEL